MKHRANPDFPKQEHIDLVDRVARAVASKWLGLTYVDTLPTGGVRDRAYEAGFQASAGQMVQRTRIPLEMAERGNEAEIRAAIDAGLQKIFPPWQG